MFASPPKVEAEKENVGQETPLTKSNAMNVERKPTKVCTLEKHTTYIREANSIVTNSEEEIGIVSFGTTTKNVILEKRKTTT